MQKKYRLLKDTPTEKAGSIFVESTYCTLPCYKCGEKVFYKPNNVENNPDWFEEIKEVKLDIPIGTKFIPIFSKNICVIKEATDNIVKITNNIGNWIGTYQIEEVNNYFKRGTWTIYKEKEFEILHEEYIPGQRCEPSPRTLTKIISVMRLSDNEIFQIGDKVIVDEFNTSPLYHKGEIIYFKIAQDGHMRVEISNGCNVSISKIEHYTQPLFFDELGNEIYEGDTFYFVNHMFWDLEKGKALYGDLRPEIEHFKFKVDAEKYIEDNKPMFSKKQVLEALDWGKYEYYKSIANTKWYNIFKEKLGL